MRSSVPSVGVEEEFILVDPHTGEPVPKNSDVAEMPRATVSSCNSN